MTTKQIKNSSKQLHIGGKQRKKVERMLIKDYAFLLENKQNVDFLKISPYKLANDKII